VKDVSYLDTASRGRAPEIEHRYGANVHILADAFLLTLLARLCSDTTFQPEIGRLVELLYEGLSKVILSHEFPTKVATIETRMIHHNEEGVYEGTILDPDTKTVVVDIARAGIVPSLVVFDVLNHALTPRLVRQDHVFMNRKVDAKNQVIGVDISGSKIGGDVEDTIVIVPDPMGATGSSSVNVIDIYKKQVKGPARKFIVAHLIITPEYIRRVKKDHPDAVIYACRLDRGLSPPDVLKTVPGTRWDDERGLNDKQYIVPGGGGFGEILNNSFV
jgi:uracil phosphoribosyltransferase